MNKKITVLVMAEGYNGELISPDTATVGKKAVTAKVGTISKVYDGKTGAVVRVDFNGLLNNDVLAQNVDYKALADFADKNAGTGIAITGTVTLLNGSLGKNYSLADGTLSGQTGEITATIPAYYVTNQKIKIGNPLVYIQAPANATGLMTGIGFEKEVVEGVLTWSETENGVALDNSYTFSGSAGDAKTLYWTFTPSSSNYETVTGSPVFTLTDKDVPILTVADITKTYNGIEGHNRNWYSHGGQ